MYDIRGIFRGLCMDCGENECIEFEAIEGQTFCGYCGCPPTKHQKPQTVSDACKSLIASMEVSSETESTPLSTESDLGEPVVVPSLLQSNTVQEPLSITSNESSYRSLCSLIPNLPKFSKSVEDALLNGTIKGKLWPSMIMQCSAHYVDCQEMNKRSSYEVVGRRMFDKYPSIESSGLKPWSMFTRALSQRIRKDRQNQKSFGVSIRDKDFPLLQAMAVKKNAVSKKMLTGERTDQTLSRSQASVASTKQVTEASETIVKIQEEWKKKEPEKALLKAYLRESFNARTSLLNENLSFTSLISDYPCFTHADYFLYEFSMIIGSKALQDAKEKLKEFFTNIQKVQEHCDKVDKYEPLLSAWLYFEKKCGIYQTKAKKSMPIIEVLEDDAEFQERIKNVPQTQPPCAVVLMQEKEITDGAILYAGHFIEGTANNILTILTVVMAVYYSLELNYPKEYVQGMGALGHYVLGHNYYKLGVRALNMLAQLSDISH